jgi:hypothetical protein
MSEINLTSWFPHGTIIRGSLLSEYDPVNDLPLLDQDVLEVVLPTGFSISVGWFPQYDPSGSFRISLFNGNGTLARVPIEGKTPGEVLKYLEILGEQYGRRQDDPVAIAAPFAGSTASVFRFTRRNQLYALV